MEKITPKDNISRPNDFIQEACKATGISHLDLMSGNRKDEVVDLRHALCVLFKRAFDYEHKQIGEILNINQSLVAYAKKRLYQSEVYDNNFFNYFNDLSLRLCNMSKDAAEVIKKARTERDMRNRKNGLIPRSEVMKVIELCFESANANIKTRDNQEATLFGNYVTVLESDIKNSIKLIKSINHE